VTGRLAIGFALLILSAACTPPQVQRPLEGAQPNVDRSMVSTADARARTDSGVPPTLSPATPSSVATTDPGLASSPSPPPSPTPEPGYVIVATDGRGANLRDGPGTSSRVITTLAEGTPVEVFDEQVSAEGRPWRRIRSGNREGWVVAPVVRRR
jgi:hypothetical protein